MANIIKSVNVESVKANVKEITPYTETVSNALSDVKNALVDKGYADDSTPITKLDDVINNELASVQKTWGDVASQCDEFNSMELSTNGTNYYYITNDCKYMYISNSTSSYGLYGVNLETGESKRLITTGQNWKYFFETSDGSVLVSSSDSSVKGLYKLNGLNREQMDFGELSAGYSYQYFYESKNGDVLISNSSGLFKISGNQAIAILTGYHINNFWEYGNQLFFGSSHYSHYQLYYYDGNTATSIPNTNNAGLSQNPITEILKSSSGQIYGWNTTMQSGFMRINGANSVGITKLESIKKVVEDSFGNIYVVFNGSVTKVYLLKDDVLQELENTNYANNYNILNSDGNLYFSANYSSSPLVKLDGENVTVISTTESGNFVKDDNYIYMYSRDGVYVIEKDAEGNDTVTKINTADIHPDNIAIKGNYGNIYVCGDTNLVTINNKVVTVITTPKKCGYCSQDKNGKYYFATTEYPEVGSIVYVETENGLVGKIYGGE